MELFKLNHFKYEAHIMSEIKIFNNIQRHVYLCALSTINNVY